MSHLPIRQTLAVVILLATFLFATTASTRAQTDPGDDIDYGDPTQPIDVVVLLDDSGSMATCWPWPQDAPPFGPPCGEPSENPPSDPSNLRYSAARLLLQLADPADRLAIVRFDNAAEGAGALGTLQPVGDATNRRTLAATLQPPTNFNLRGYTRIDLGLQAASNLLLGQESSERTRYVLLLTDGEPSSQPGEQGQPERITALLEALRADGVLVFPVVLCNETAGCQGDFLREQFTDGRLREAATAQDLLTVFSELFAQMKPDRSVIEETAGDALRLTTRRAHGVQELAFITPRGALTSLRRTSGDNGATVVPTSDFDDPNISVDLVTGEALQASADEMVWTAQTGGNGFVVAQAASYPQLVNPPPSLADSPASTRYYPAGKPPLLVARGIGPGADEPILYNGNTPLDPFGTDELRTLLLNESPRRITLQLGDDEQPLRLVRDFVLAERDDLPTAEVISPAPGSNGLLDDGRARLRVGFAAGAEVADPSATVYVFDESEGEGDTPVYQAVMSCQGRVCTDDGFTPSDGRSYRVFYILQGETATEDAGAIRFSDWAEGDLTLRPAVYLRGLPLSNGTLDLATMPEEGWPIELSSGTVEEIGELRAQLVLNRIGEDGEETEAPARLDFALDVPETGAVNDLLRVDGLADLRPGEYSGELTLAALSPAGRPTDVEIRPGDVVPVTLAVARPGARVESQRAAFEDVLFDTSPNFRLNETTLLPVRFVGQPFALTATMESSSCPGVSVTSGELTERDGQTVLPLTLTSNDVVEPATCMGALALNGPARGVAGVDYEITPNQIDWRATVRAVEWSIVNSELNLGDLVNSGERIEQELLVRFTGRTPFVLQLTEFSATSGASPNGESASTDNSLSTNPLTTDYLEMPPVEVTGDPNEAGLYEVPVTFFVRQDVPNDPLRGTFFSGDLALNVVGLPGATQTLDVTLRSPSLAQRYVYPWLLPLYTLPVGLCMWPLTLFLLLVIVARTRSRGYDDDELESVAVAATQRAADQMTSSAPGISFGSGGFNNSEFGEAASAGGASTNGGASSAGAWGGAGWGGSEWGSVTQSDVEATGATWDGGWDDNASVAPKGSFGASGTSDTAGDENPWQSGW